MTNFRNQLIKCTGAAVIAAILGFAVPAAEATTFFSDNFDGENGGKSNINHTGLSNWTVTSGAIDLVGNGRHDILPGNGLYVDLVGSFFCEPGTIESRSIALNPGNYELSFDLAGSNRVLDNDKNKLTVSIAGLFSEQLVRQRFDPFITETIAFTVNAVTNVKIVFAHAGAKDNAGALLDNVSLHTAGSGAGSGSHTAVPEPASMTMGLMGLAALAAGLRRRRMA